MAEPEYSTEVHRDYHRRGGNWGWLLMLLLPVFFFVGWIANDALERTDLVGTQPGVGGGPLENEAVSPTPTPTGAATPTMTPTETPSPTPEDEERPVLEF